MSQHGCPERLSNRSKGFQEDAPSQPTMEVLVETLTGTAFEMTVSPSDTILAIKSKIFRVEGIPVSQQHILYNMKELDDSSSLRSHAITDGARLRLVLGMRVGPISTRRLPPPASVEPWRDIERLLDGNRDESEWCNSNGCRVTVVVLRDGGRINLLLRQNSDGAYCPLDTLDNKYSSSLTLVEHELDGDVSESVHDNEVTMGKMVDLRRRMDSLAVRKGRGARDDKPEIQKTRSEESLSGRGLLDDSEPFKSRASFAPLYDGYTRYDLDCHPDRYTLLPPLEWSVGTNLPPIGTRTDSEPSVQDTDADRLKLSDALAGSILVQGRREREEDGAILEECLDSDQCHIREESPQLAAKNLAPIPAAEYGPLVCGSSPGWRGAWTAALSPPPPRAPRPAPISHSASSLHSLHALHSLHSLHTLAAPLRPPHAPRHPPLQDAVFSSSTSDLEKLKRNSRMLPALSRHRPRSHLHLSDDGLDLRPAPVGQGRRAREFNSVSSVNNSRNDLHQHAHALADLNDQFVHNDFRAVGSFKPDFKAVGSFKSDFNKDFKELNTIEVCRNDVEAERNVEINRFKFDDDVIEDVKKTQSEVTQKDAGSRPRLRCSWCRKRLSIATEHRCRCGSRFCAPHRYAEVHGCHYDYRAPAAPPPRAAPRLPKI